MELIKNDRPALDKVAERWRAGDEDAAGEIWALCGARLLRLARSLSHGDSQAEDAVQEAFLRAWRHIGRYNPARPFEPWITTIVVRECRRLHSRTPNNNPLLQEPVQEETPNRLYAAIEELPRPLRETVALHYLHGYNGKEIASALGIPEGTVKSRLHRARALLHQALKEELG